MTGEYARGLMELDATLLRVLHPLTPLPLPPSASKQEGPRLSRPADEGWAADTLCLERTQSTALLCVMRWQAPSAPAQTRPRRGKPAVLPRWLVAALAA